MGRSLAEAALAMGHEVLIVSGPVSVTYPAEAEILQVVSTDEMLSVCQEHFVRCDGLIGVAAPCDYQPQIVRDRKITKTGEPLVLHLVETPDIVATLSASKRNDQWVVGFALETDDHRFRAITKLEKKSCDLIVLNRPQAMHSTHNDIEILDPQGEIVLSAEGLKSDVSREIFQVVQSLLID